MEIAKIKVIKKKPLVYIDRKWFPYRNIVDTSTFDDFFCQEIECAIDSYGKRKVIVYYDIEQIDAKNRPIKILVGFKVKGKSHEWCKYWFNTIHDSKPLTFRCTFGVDPNVDPFIFKRFMSPEDYICEDSKSG